MKTRSTLRLAAIALAVTMAMPLSASARHHRSEDVLAGAVVGAVVGTFIAAAASSSVEIAPAYPAPVFYGPATPPPPPNGLYYHCAPPPRPAFRHRPPPPPPCQPLRGPYYKNCR